IITYRDLTRHEKLIEFDKEKSPEVGLWWDMRFSNCQTTEARAWRFMLAKRSTQKCVTVFVADNEMGL
ncbi:hypothetical protein, partial [Xiamenia xianingshaonis]|uniref:hypothetical protein n=1 Tax=Xiamenia xianingshaonis TaxID=2682776 RepID=UPI0021BDC339